MRLNQGYFSGETPEGCWRTCSFRANIRVISVTFAVSLDMAGDQSAFVQSSRSLNLSKMTSESPAT